MSNAVVDRVIFDGSNLKNVKFENAVITGEESLLFFTWQYAAPCLAPLVKPEERQA